jgi:mono/diheme cytochrome c family protein
MLRNKSKSVALVACLTLGSIGFSACRQDMHDNPKFKAYRDGGMRQLPEGTVARGSLELNPAAPKIGSAQPAAATPATVGQVVPAAPVGGAQLTPATNPAAAASATASIPTGEDGFPFKVTKEILDRGQSRFNISCSPCHSMIGDGNGMIVHRGFRRPPSYHTERLRKAPASYFYDVITNGFGAMPSYSDQLTPEDRWKVIAYIRVLQLSQGANAPELAEADKKKLEEADQKSKEKSGSHSETRPAAQPAAQPAGGQSN